MADTLALVQFIFPLPQVEDGLRQIHGCLACYSLNSFLASCCGTP